ncbi:Kinesin-1-like protein PSS1 [Zostera marina]|uniref:Kinesin-like protein n=1 Tax=Zostera marina TaxID=29655 RepID=A0A0K9Q4S1_ZOSMR|nr:Kinesin-1-like protein PSS1 [Zostera marina]
MIYTLGPPTTLTCESTDRFPCQIRTLNVARTTVTVTGGGADNTTIHQNMSKIRVCVRFRPLNSTEKKQFDGKLCVKELDDESFLFNAEREENVAFCFDKVFYQNSKQHDVYEFLAKPMVHDVLDLMNSTIITYGQTGAGKTYTMEGPDISNCEESNKGLIPRVIEELFRSIECSNERNLYTIKLSMVEIYMEKIRDLFDITKDNIQIKESKMHGVFLSGVTEVSIMDKKQALSFLERGISNRTVGATQMNMSSSRSHCLYIFSVQKESRKDKRSKTGKLILVDLAGSEKVEKTGAEGKVFEEAKTINKSLSALGNVINALTTGKSNHIPYRDSKLTRVLQDSLGGFSHCALLCCCSASFINTSESLSTLRFGIRSKFIKMPVNVSQVIDEEKPSHSTSVITDKEMFQRKNRSHVKILEKLKENWSMEDSKLLEELLISEGILFGPDTCEEKQSACDDIVNRTISSLHQAIKDREDDLNKLRFVNNILKVELAKVRELNLAKDRELFANRHFRKIINGFSLIFHFPFTFLRMTTD